ncbi:MAG: hypothetical protein AAGI23_19420, partial [Bacteroidota bacterium]
MFHIAILNPILPALIIIFYLLCHRYYTQHTRSFIDHIWVEQKVGQTHQIPFCSLIYQMIQFFSDMSMVFVSPRVGTGKADGLFILALP